MHFKMCDFIFKRQQYVFWIRDVVSLKECSLKTTTIRTTRTNAVEVEIDLGFKVEV